MESQVTLYDKAIQTCQNGRWDNESKRKRFNLLCDYAREATRRFPRLPILQVGVWHGHSTYMLAETCPSTKIIALDSFQGLVDWESEDGNRTASERDFLQRHFTADYDTVRRTLGSHRNVELVKADATEFQGYLNYYSLLAIDVDLYKPTFASLMQFETSTRGVVYIDDYGFKDFPGATAAVHKYYTTIASPGYFVPQEYGSLAIIKG